VCVYGVVYVVCGVVYVVCVCVWCVVWCMWCVCVVCGVVWNKEFESLPDRRPCPLAEQCNIFSDKHRWVFIHEEEEEAEGSDDDWEDLGEDSQHIDGRWRRTKSKRNAVEEKILRCSRCDVAGCYGVPWQRLIMSLFVFLLSASLFSFSLYVCLPLSLCLPPSLSVALSLSPQCVPTHMRIYIRVCVSGVSMFQQVTKLFCCLCVRMMVSVCCNTCTQTTTLGSIGIPTVF